MKKIYFFLIICFFNIEVYAQSDFCADAVEVIPTLAPPFIFFNGSFNGSTISTPPPSCAPNASQDVWYKFTATEMMNGITIGASTLSQIGVVVYDSDCNGTPMMCDYNTNIYGVTSISNNYIVGHIYYLRIFNGSPTATNVNFICRVEKYPQPINDSCANAITIVPEVETCSFSVKANFGGSTIGNPASCTPGASQDVWYKFVATNKMMLVSFSANNTIDVAVELYDGSCSGNLLICRNYNGLGASDGAFYNNFVIGNTYYLRAVNVSSRPSGSYNFYCLLNYPAPVNDLCADAIQLIPNSTCSSTPGTFSGAALDGNESTSCSQNSSQDVWYKFMATSHMMSVTITGVPNISDAFEIYDGTCNGPMVVCRDNNGIGFGEITNYSSFIVGHEYYIRVVNATGKPLSLDNFTICVQDPSLGETEINSKSIKVYPNPADNFIEVSNVDSTVNYELYNHLGQSVRKDYFRNNQIDIEDIQAGIYLLKISDGLNSVIKKIIKK